MKKLNKNKGLTLRDLKGFTLIEILVVIGIIAILATIVIIAINPARQFAQARNTQRESNVETILNAIGQNIADNKGVLICNPTVTITSATSSIGTAGAANLGPCLVPTYIPSAIPTDPLATTTGLTGYDISKDSFGRYMVCAPLASLETAISVTPPAICLTR